MEVCSIEIQDGDLSQSIIDSNILDDLLLSCSFFNFFRNVAVATRKFQIKSADCIKISIRLCWPAMLNSGKLLEYITLPMKPFYFSILTTCLVKCLLILKHSVSQQNIYEVYQCVRTFVVWPHVPSIPPQSIP